MKFTDRVYGNIEIEEPVILALIHSSTLQRLKEIDQAGYFEPHFPGTAHSRFEHSVGVYWLLKTHDAPLEEQIAGLIHDVSHSAFSHCIDYVLDAGSGENHSYQDDVFEEFVRKSEIPEILKRFSLGLEYILDDNNFPLKERDLPDLCADRIDYSLRIAAALGEIKDGADYLNDLSAEKGKWIFKAFETAEKYAELFLKLNSVYLSGLPSAAMFVTVGDYLRHALSKQYISEGDLYTTDRNVLKKIEPHLKADSRLNLLFNRMNRKIGFRNDPNDFDATVFCKSRIVDPLCRHKGKIERLSKIKSAWNKIVERESKPKEYFLKFDR